MFSPSCAITEASCPLLLNSVEMLYRGIWFGCAGVRLVFVRSWLIDGLDEASLMCLCKLNIWNLCHCHSTGLLLGKVGSCP